MKFTASQLNEMLYTTAVKYADKPALEIGDISYTYDQLLKDALQWAATINRHYSANESLIPVYADKSYSCFVSIFGVVMSGKGYVPINPSFPLKRNREILEALEIKKILISQEAGSFINDLNDYGEGEYRGISRYPVTDKSYKQAPVDPDRILYLLFTSGSTGKPKGVPVSESNLIAYLENTGSILGICQEDRCSQTFDLTFDLSVHDIFVTWTNGACLVIPENPNPIYFSKYIKEKKISCWFSVPSVGILMDRMRLLKTDVFHSLRLSIFCGEPLLEDIACKWKKSAPSSRIINFYGPTEGTIAISSYEWKTGDSPLSENGIVSIGEAFPGQEFRVDEKMELLISGSQVVHEYYHDRDVTEAHFAIDKMGRNWYSTGDLVRISAEGLFFFSARKDAEIKIHGYRINLHEIDSRLRTFLGNNQVVSLADKEIMPEKIISFIVPEGNRTYEVKDIVDYCKSILPWYMVPETVIFVDHFPLNANGKVDRRKLREIWHGKSAY